MDSNNNNNDSADGHPLEQGRQDLSSGMYRNIINQQFLDGLLQLNERQAQDRNRLHVEFRREEQIFIDGYRLRQDLLLEKQRLDQARYIQESLHPEQRNNQQHRQPSILGNSHTISIRNNLESHIHAQGSNADIAPSRSDASYPSRPFARPNLRARNRYWNRSSDNPRNRFYFHAVDSAAVQVPFSDSSAPVHHPIHIHAPESRQNSVPATMGVPEPVLISSAMPAPTVSPTDVSNPLPVLIGMATSPLAYEHPNALADGYVHTPAAAPMSTPAPDPTLARTPARTHTSTPARNTIPQPALARESTAAPTAVPTDAPAPAPESTATPLAVSTTTPMPACMPTAISSPETIPITSSAPAHGYDSAPTQGSIIGQSERGSALRLQQIRQNWRFGTRLFRAAARRSSGHVSDVVNIGDRNEDGGESMLHQVHERPDVASPATEGSGQVQSGRVDGATLPQLDSLRLFMFRSVQQEAARRLNGEVDHAQYGNRLILEDLCVVCSEHYNISDVVTVLPCGHVVHHECAWYCLSIQNECPQCRRPLNEW